jgi:hypothetical protein
MAIARTLPPPSPEELERRREEFIQGGLQHAPTATPAQAAPKPVLKTAPPPPRTRPSKRQKVILGIPSEILLRVDTVKTLRRMPPSRNTWIVEAILEKLDREEKTSS